MSLTVLYQATCIRRICTLPQVPSSCVIMHSWTRMGCPGRPVLDRDRLGPCGHGVAPLSVPPRTRMCPCSPRPTLSPCPCGSMPSPWCHGEGWPHADTAAGPPCVGLVAHGSVLTRQHMPPCWHGQAWALPNANQRCTERAAGTAGSCMKRTHERQCNYPAVNTTIPKTLSLSLFA